MLPSPTPPAGSATALPGRPEHASAFPALAPLAIERLHRIRGDLKLGLPVVLEDGAESVLVSLAETLTEARYTAMTALGVPELVLTRRRATALGATPPVQGDTLRLRVPVGADLAWIAAVAGQSGTDLPKGAAGLPILQGATALQRAAIEVATTVQAMPAVLAVPLTGRDGSAVADLGLSILPLSLVT